MTEQAPIHLPLIGEKAPAFKAKTTQGEIDFPKCFEGKWVVFFSHPADFTPVCTTEFMTFASMQPEFEKRNCKLLGLSIDSIYAHIAWLRTIKEKIQYKDMKNVEVTFPVIEDLKMDVSKAFGMLQPGASSTQAVRAVFIIDPKGIVRAILYYPLSNGRNMDEVMRLLIAMQTSDAARHRHAGQLEAGRRRDRAAAGFLRRGQGAHGEGRPGREVPGLVHVPEEVPENMK